jgi:hypothetical protein
MNLDYSIKFFLSSPHIGQNSPISGKSDNPPGEHFPARFKGGNSGVGYSRAAGDNKGNRRCGTDRQAITQSITIVA